MTNNNSELLLSVINESAGKQVGEEILQSIKELQAVGEITWSDELFGEDTRGRGSCCAHMARCLGKNDMRPRT